ncbi:endolytic transglycosylase MltG [Patescibacteria group bacterium]
MKKLLSLLVIGALIFGAVYSYKTIYSPVDLSSSESFSINIKKGMPAKEIASLLKEKDLIRNETTFYYYVRLFGADTNIIAGRYDLNKSMNVPKILEEISKIGSSEATITIQEGLTISQIDDKLFEMDVIEDNEFENAVRAFDSYENYWFLNLEVQSKLDLPLEGYLYPDTYFIDTFDFNSEAFITLLLDNFQKKIETVKSPTDSSGRSMHDTITMASILQREVRTPDDFEIVAGILWKRLDSNWHIGADATILYATKKKKIDVEDLEFDSPYNTRLHVGMPPGPICNPDIEHIKATMNPEDSEYWYYLTTLDTGEVIYARNNDEHNVNKAKYL